MPDVMNAFSDWVMGFGLGALGVVPFLHTNTLLAALPEASALLVVVLSFSHLAFETLPSVFFGVPGQGQGVSALPSHDLVRKGRSRAALQAALEGLVLGLLGALALSAAFWLWGPLVLAAVRPIRVWLLLALAVVVWVSDGPRPMNALALAAFGFLGFAAFSLPLQEPLFPLLSGLFGLPALFFSDATPARLEGPTARLSRAWPLIGCFLGAFSVLLPALSPSWVASIALLLVPAGPEVAVSLLAAISSSRMLFDFLAVPVLGVARSAATVRWKLAALTAFDGLVLLAVGVLAFILAVALCGRLANAWCRLSARVPPRGLALVLLLLAVLVAWGLDGFWGVFLLAWSVSASVLSLRLRVPRKYVLGVLVLPAVLFAWAG